MGAGESGCHSLGGEVATLDASDGHRVGEPCPGLVGHLLGPGPRLPPEGAGGHPCMGPFGAEAATEPPLSACGRSL